MACGVVIVVAMMLPSPVPMLWLYRQAVTHAEVVSTGGTEFGPGSNPEMIRIKPKRILSWGIDTNWNAPANARFVA